MFEMRKEEGDRLMQGWPTANITSVCSNNTCFVRATKMLIYCVFWQSYLELQQRLENMLASLKFNLDKL